MAPQWSPVTKTGKTMPVVAKAQTAKVAAMEPGHEDREDWRSCTVSRGRVAGGISAPGSHRSVRDSLPSYGSCCPDHLVAGFAQAQCAKYRGWDAAAFLMEWIAFFHVLSFLYLFMIHRSR